ncbi:MAG: aminotransferase class V-fold PLP-dependent enzyme [Verrucomicrobiota bacterium]|nr:aminotransferase class V-fold PLP-dependent enzyme [Verrucomicrobiota bacterium]
MHQKQRIYFDNAASSPPLPSLIENYIRLTNKNYANPNASHSAGLECLKLIRKSEQQILNILCRKSSEKTNILWTASATEAANIAIMGFCSQLDSGEILTTPIEHKAISNTLEHINPNLKIRTIPLNDNITINTEKLREILSDSTKLIAIHHVNNELGIIQNLEEIDKLRQEHAPDAKLLADTTQSCGKIDIPWDSAHIDMMIASSHKFHGIHGTGSLIFRKDLKLNPLIHGGYQQLGIHSGTLNVPGIAAYAETIEIMNQNIQTNLKKIREINKYLRENLKSRFKKKVVFHSSANISSPYILSFALKGYQGAVIMRALGNKNIIIGTGSACASETRTPNTIITATTISKELAYSTLRLSLGQQNTLQEAEIFLRTLEHILENY